jgi:hypothetical protein
MSISAKGKLKTEETKHKISEGHKGLKYNIPYNRIHNSTGKSKPIGFGENISNNIERGLNISKSRYKSIIQYTLDNIYVKEWKGALDVRNTLGLNHSNITQCCKGNQKTAYGYKWIYKK